MKEIKNILVAVALDNKDEPLLDYSMFFAKRLNAKIWLIHVAAPNPDFVGYEVGPQYIRDIRADDLKDEHKTIRKYSERLKSADVQTDGLLIQGPTAKMLVAEAEKLKIDLIILGLQQHGILSKVFNVDTSKQIIKISKIPLLIIPLE